ncbi:MAG: hypothetical protein IJ751_05865, partial [Oscillospiraceae bacterium]|nr:hypothetical protein [Oscillospiraceae bacterium]
MSSLGSLYRYELKKIVHRRLTLVLLALLLLTTLLLNLQSIPLYSVGSRGADLTVAEEDGGWHTDYRAMLGGIPIRWVDEDGQAAEKTVGALEYIRTQRQFARAWSGKPLDDETIQALQAFLAQCDASADDGDATGWSYQNFYWVFQSIYAVGLNPASPHTMEQAIRDEIERNQTEIMDSLQLTPAERAFWAGHKQVSLPLTMAYTPAYRQLLSNARWIHIMLVFFVIIALSESFSLERRVHT